MNCTKQEEIKITLRNNCCLFLEKPSGDQNQRSYRLPLSSLKEDTLKQLKSGNRVASEKMTFGVKDHEMTFSLIAVNLLIFTLMALRGVDVIEPGVSDILSWGGNVKGYVTGGEWWRMITSLFVHIGFLPLVVNLVGLYLTGLVAESILGKLKFLIAYLSAGALASLVSIIWVAEGVTAGASGAIFGMYGVIFAFLLPIISTKSSPGFG